MPGTAGSLGPCLSPPESSCVPEDKSRKLGLFCFVFLEDMKVETCQVKGRTSGSVSPQ